MTEQRTSIPSQWLRAAEGLDEVVAAIDAGGVAASSAERAYLVAARDTLRRLAGGDESPSGMT